MSDDLRWGPLWGKCCACNQSARLVVDTTVYPHLAGKIGVRCTLCRKPSAYEFKATVEEELASQTMSKKLAEEHLAKLPAFHPEDWPLFQAAMFGLMPQPAEPAAFTPDDRTLFIWRLMQAEGRGPLDQVEIEEDHGEFPVRRL